MKKDRHISEEERKRRFKERMQSSEPDELKIVPTPKKKKQDNASFKN